MTDLIEMYRGYEIRRYWYPLFRLEFCHVDYDGPEDNRCGVADFLWEARQQIDEIEELNAERKKPQGRE